MMPKIFFGDQLRNFLTDAIPAKTIWKARTNATHNLCIDAWLNIWASITIWGWKWTILFFENNLEILVNFETFLAATQTTQTNSKAQY